MSHNIEIKEGAIFLGDAHYSYKRDELLPFLKALHLGDITAPQLILFGDIFDALFGGVDFTIKKNQEAVELINKLSLKIEVIYLEGNHDFNLSNIFADAKVFSISQQPLLTTFGTKSLYISHGDFGGDAGYKIYAASIRNSFLLRCLGFIDSICNHCILNYLDKYLNKKDDCNNLENFRERVSKRVDGKFSCDYFIEGHFHQNKTLEFEKFKYINLAAFACNQRYFTVESNKEELQLKERNFLRRSKV